MLKLFVFILIVVGLAIYACPPEKDNSVQENDSTTLEEERENTEEKHIENPADIADDLIF